MTPRVLTPLCVGHIAPLKNAAWHGQLAIRGRSRSTIQLTRAGVYRTLRFHFGVPREPWKRTAS